MALSFNIVKQGQIIQLELDVNLQIRDVAEFFVDNQITQSHDIGVYSQNKQLYTENLDEQLNQIGTGPDDIYFIVQGDEKKKYQNTGLQQVENDQDMKVFNIVISDGNLKKTITLTLNYNTTILSDLQQIVNQYLSLSPQYAAVNLFINDLIFNGQEKLKKTLKMLNISSQSRIEARINYIGGSYLSFKQVTRETMNDYQ